MQLESALSIMGSAGKMFIRGSQGRGFFLALSNPLAGTAERSVLS